MSMMAAKRPANSFGAAVDVPHADWQIAFGAYVGATRARCATGSPLFSGGYPGDGFEPSLRAPDTPSRAVSAIALRDG